MPARRPNLRCAPADTRGPPPPPINAERDGPRRLALSPIIRRKVAHGGGGEGSAGEGRVADTDRAVLPPGRALPQSPAPLARAKERVTDGGMCARHGPARAAAASPPRLHSRGPLARAAASLSRPLSTRRRADEPLAIVIGTGAALVRSPRSPRDAAALCSEMRHLRTFPTPLPRARPVRGHARTPRRLFRGVVKLTRARAPLDSRRMVICAGGRAAVFVFRREETGLVCGSTTRWIESSSGCCARTLRECAGEVFRVGE